MPTMPHGHFSICLALFAMHAYHGIFQEDSIGQRAGASPESSGWRLVAAQAHQAALRRRSRSRFQRHYDTRAADD